MWHRVLKEVQILSIKDQHLIFEELDSGQTRFSENVTVCLVASGPEERKPAEFLLVDGSKYAVVGYVSARTDHASMAADWMRSDDCCCVFSGRFCC